MSEKEKGSRRTESPNATNSRSSRRKLVRFMASYNATGRRRSLEVDRILFFIRPYHVKEDNRYWIR